MRNCFGNAFYKLACDDSRLMIVVADISPAASMEKFRNEYPKRFVNTGVSEQSMIGICAGLALKGMRPFAYTIATFVLYRTFEFWRDDCAYQGLPVTLVGIGGGVNYATLGGTHHAMEDIAIASAVPNMQIIAPCDPDEVSLATAWCAQDNEKGPVYLRLGRAGEPVLTEKAEPFVMGKLRYLSRGEKIGFISYGVVLKMVVDAAKITADRVGHAVTVVNCHTLKPLDKPGLQDFLTAHDKVIVVEEMVPTGGLTAQIKSLAFDNQLKCEIKALTLQDKFLHVYGSHADLLTAHGISIDHIVQAAQSWRG
jgi:transketolase